MKRGELLGLPLVYLFAIIVGALVLIFGVRMIFNVVNTADYAAVATFVNNFRRDVETYYYLSSDSYKDIKLNLPKKVQYVCFKNDSFNSNTNLISGNEYSLVLGSKEEIFMKQNRNLFLIPINAYQNTAFNIDYLNVAGASSANNIYCKRNGATIRITSKGAYVEVS